MQVKYFRPDGKEEIVELPDDAAQPDMPREEDHVHYTMSPAEREQVWMGASVLAFLLLVVTVCIVWINSSGC